MTLNLFYSVCGKGYLRHFLSWQTAKGVPMSRVDWSISVIRSTILAGHGDILMISHVLSEKTLYSFILYMPFCSSDSNEMSMCIVSLAQREIQRLVLIWNLFYELESSCTNAVFKKLLYCYRAHIKQTR